jgi:hypothetical protein
VLQFVGEIYPLIELATPVGRDLLFFLSFGLPFYFFTNDTFYVAYFLLHYSLREHIFKIC